VSARGRISPRTVGAVAAATNRSEVLPATAECPTAATASSRRSNFCQRGEEIKPRAKARTRDVLDAIEHEGSNADGEKESVRRELDADSRRAFEIADRSLRRTTRIVARGLGSGSLRSDQYVTDYAIWELMYFGHAR
jgi:hypothetical protein